MTVRGIFPHAPYSSSGQRLLINQDQMVLLQRWKEKSLTRDGVQEYFGTVDTQVLAFSRVRTSDAQGRLGYKQDNIPTSRCRMFFL